MSLVVKSDDYEIVAPHVPAGVTDHPSLFSGKIAYVPGDNLGSSDAYEDESRWEISGGSLHLQSTNQTTGGEVSYIFRVGMHDELEVVKKVVPVHGDASYETVSKFGFKRRNENSVMSDRGIIDFVSVGPVITLTTFLPYSHYSLIAGISDEPVTTTDLLENIDNCFVVPNVSPGQNVTHSFETDKKVNGDTLTTGTVWVNAIVKEDGDGGLMSTQPRSISFVL